MSTWRRNFLAVWLANTITAVGMMAFLPFLPLYLEEMGVTDERALRMWSGVLVGAAPLMAAFMGPVWGSLGDRLGRKPMIVRANLAICLFVGAMAFARTPLQLLTLRLLQGVFSGYIAPSLTLVSAQTDDARQGRVVGTLQTGVILGMAVGPLLGGALADQWGYRPVFFVTAALSLLAVFVVALGAREERPPQAAGEKDEAVSGQAASALRGLWRGVLRDVRTVVAGGPLRQLVLAAFALRLGAAIVDPILSLFVRTLHGVDVGAVATMTGTIFAVRGVATLVTTPFWGWLGDRFGHGRMMTLCGMGTGMAMLPQAFVDDVGTLLVLRLVSGACMAGTVPALWALAAKLSPSAKRGSAYGLTFSSLGLAHALGPLGGGTLAALFGLRSVFVVSTVLLLAAALVVRRVPVVARPATETR